MSYYSIQDIQARNFDSLAHSAVTVGITTSVVLAANPNRVYLMLQNDSANLMYLFFGGSAATNTGIRLEANGGTVIFDGFISKLELQAIAASASSNLLITEG